MTGGAFDSHLHLTDSRFDPDRPAVLSRAREAGVTAMVTVATNPEDARAAIELAAAEPDISATAGLHPHEAERFDASVLAELEVLADDPRVVAIGETGLDFHYDNSPRDLQDASFRAQLELAAARELPIVVHSRSAEAETIAILREYSGRTRGVLHCFTGGEALLRAGLEAEWMVSFSGIVTFAADVAALVTGVPDERLLIETDSPYLSPVPRRDVRRNEPAHLVHTAARVADLRGQPVEELIELTAHNARRFYRL